MKQALELCGVGLGWIIPWSPKRGLSLRGRGVADAGALCLIPFALLWGRFAEARHWRLDTEG